MPRRSTARQSSLYGPMNNHEFAQFIKAGIDCLAYNGYTDEARQATANLAACKTRAQFSTLFHDLRHKLDAYGL